jgi:hypothetical protein
MDRPRLGQLSFSITHLYLDAFERNYAWHGSVVGATILGRSNRDGKVRLLILRSGRCPRSF